MKKVNFRRKRPAWGAYPSVSINNAEVNAAKNFPSNKITTTKYTPYNFLPKNLFERRSQSDKQVNNLLYEVLENGKFESRYSKDIKVGDVVKVINDQPFPSDLLLLCTPLEEGACYIETAQLDGETNLKVHKALAETNVYGDNISQVKGTVESDTPNANLYKFRGKLTLSDNTTYSLSEKHLLLRGAQLRNTPYVVGVVIYTGKDTKLSLNQKNPPSKFSTVERRLNRSVVGIFCFKISCVILLTGLSGAWIDNTFITSFYLWRNSPYEENSLVVQIIQSFFSYFAILSFLIPVSLMVTLEVVKVSQVQFMEWDEMMSDNERVHGRLEVMDHEIEEAKGKNLVESDVIEIVAAPPTGHKRGSSTDKMMRFLRKPTRGMSAKNSNLNDELGLVKYVFSDKTGTLTENHMEFSKCSIAGVMYDHAMHGQLREELMSPHYKLDQPFEPIREFLWDMALCHSAIPAQKNDKMVYQSQSPDEAALCDAARANDFEFIGRSNEGLRVQVLGEIVVVIPLIVFEFSSDRRRMSVIVRMPDGRIMLYSKGADIVMFTRLRSSESTELITKTKDDISTFSREGLRTLILACREIPQEEWEVLSTEYQKANISIENREEQIDAIADAVELNLMLIGVTAIEDRLQDGVPDTIDFLLKAGMRVWIITGDKQETAINIGYSCKLLTPGFPLIILNAHTTEDCKQLLEQALAAHKGEKPKSKAENEDKSKAGVGLVVDGETLVFALAEHSQLFLQVAALCRSVVCCRVTPLQKALVVRTVKQATKRVCLSIGDGANDVSMIQEANIGVGIFGKEGTQAARASDYALLRFRHLARLIAVHGRYSMLRNAGIIKYSFYKNMAFFFVQFWFSFYNGYSAQTIYDDWVVTLFNTLFTSIPPYFMALFEKDIDEDVIMKYPQLFKRCQKGYLFSYYSVFWWVLNGVFHSFLFFFATYLLFTNGVISSHGWPADLSTIGFIASSFSVVVILLKAALETRYWNWIVHVGIWGSLLVYVIVGLIDSASAQFNTTAYFTFYLMLGLPEFWIILLLLTVGCLLPDFTIKFLKHSFAPEDWHVLKERKRKRLPDVELAFSEIVLPTSGSPAITNKIAPDDKIVPDESKIVPDESKIVPDESGKSAV